MNVGRIVFTQDPASGVDHENMRRTAHALFGDDALRACNAWLRDAAAGTLPKSEHSNPIMVATVAAMISGHATILLAFNVV